MRLSCDKDDAGYLAWGKLNGDGQRVTVFLDGIQQKHVIMADDEAGELRRIVISENGNMAKGHDEFISEVVHGEVRFVIEPRV